MNKDNTQQTTQNTNTTASAAETADPNRRRSSIERFQDFRKFKATESHTTAGHDHQHLHETRNTKPGVLGNLWASYVKGH